MKDALESFLETVPDSNKILSKHQAAIALFGFYLSEIQSVAITPASIANCYKVAHLRAPRNLSDAMSKSGAFVHEKKQWTLHRDTIAKFKASFLSVSPRPEINRSDEIARTVMVVYGRDEQTRLDLFGLLRAIDLKPIEWNEAISLTGKASPYIGEILDAAFSMAQAFVVLMSPDEKVVLRPELQKEPRDGEESFQPRANVILEAGMALAKDENRTVLVSTGNLRGMSDTDGRHIVHLNNSARARHNLVHRLKVAGCNFRNEGTDWLTVGDFERYK